MGNHIPDLKTDEKLLKNLKDAESRDMTADEVLEQRVSFVYGVMGADSDVTRERIRQVISKQEGRE